MHVEGRSPVVLPAIRPVAHDQIGGFLNIPAKYYDRMAAEAPELLTDNVNLWLKRSNDRRMLRTMGGDLRAFLSDRYQRIENEEIAETVLPILFDAKVQIRSCEVTERRMYITAVVPTIRAEVKVGDVVEAGVTISNSEVGLGAVVVAPFIHRLVCLNGMTINDAKLSARHVGRRISDGEDLNRIYQDDTRKADDHALLLRVRDVVRSAMDEGIFKQRVDRMTALTEGKVTGDPTKVVEVLAQKVGATENEKGGILRSLIQGGDLSAWGLLNAVTHQAHAETVSYDRGMEFAAAGGQLLDLPKTEWKRILEAA
jgi:hypothetical protein